MLNAVRIWILLSTLLVASGWILSALQQLNRIGYGIAFALAIVAAVFWQRKTGWRPQKTWAQLRRKFFKRFKRPLPALFLLLSFLSLLGGILYPPVTGDGMYYRTPRVLHWIAAEHWHWIRTFDIRMNIADCGFEWLTAPLILFTRSDRFIFLINIFSYLMLPGLVFSVFIRLKIHPRVAWWWMWLLPAGWCYMFQAGTIANDSFAAVYALASIDLALRARECKRAGDLFLSLLAMALLTGAKQTNVPLALLWLIAASPFLKMLLTPRIRMKAYGVVLVSLLVSALPMVCINLWHGGNWAGVPKDPGADWEVWKKIEIHSPFWGIIGNVLSLGIQNFAPPFFPSYQTWNENMRVFMFSDFGSHFSSFEHFGSLTPFLTEQTAGLGITICLLLLGSIFWTWQWEKKFPSIPRQPFGWQINCLLWVPWALLILFMAKVGAWENARQLAPYYPLLLPLILIQRGMSVLVRRSLWIKCGTLSVILAALILVLSPAHPLWPARTILRQWGKSFPDSNFIARTRELYDDIVVNDAMRHAFENSFPPGEKIIGYGTNPPLGIESRLWHPFDRRVERLLPTDTRRNLEQRNIRYVVVDDTFLYLKNCSIEELLQSYHSQIVDELDLPKAWNRPPQHLYLIRLND